MKNPQSSLPSGFRFHPTDEELILHYLKKKVTSASIPVSIIADVDIYKFDPWDLPAKAVLGEKEWYFFSPRDRKYPNGARPNRAAASGYWKATGTDKVIMSPPATVHAAGGGGGGVVGQANIGVKKALVFYKGKPPKGIKTNWIMHEYRLTDTQTMITDTKPKPKDSSMRLDDWVLCRIYKKSHALPPSARPTISSSDQDQEDRFVEESTLLLPDMINNSNPNLSNKTALMSQKSLSFSNLLDSMDYSMLSSFMSDADPQQFLTSGYDATTATLDLQQQQQQPQPQPQPQQPNLLISNNFNKNISGGSNSSYLFQKLPDQLNSSTPLIAPNMENKLKRQTNPNLIDLDEDVMAQYPSKKFSTCCYTNNSSNGQADHYSFLNQSFLNQKMLLRPHLQFQG